MAVNAHVFSPSGTGLAADGAERRVRCPRPQAPRLCTPHPSQVGDVAVTTAGALPARFVFHAVTLGPRGATTPTEEIIRRTTAKCLALLKPLGASSIAFPQSGPDPQVSHSTTSPCIWPRSSPPIFWPDTIELKLLSICLIDPARWNHSIS
jgi:hypothetical protein